MTSKLYPYAGRHAVQSAAFVLSFQSEMASDELAALASVHDAISDVYPAKDPIQSLSLQFGPGGASTTVKETGWNFSRPIPVEERSAGKAVVQRSVNVQNSDLTILENDYDRWAGFKSNVCRCLDVLGPIAFERRSLASITLRYTDVFLWKGERSEIEADGVFSISSILLPRHVFDVGPNYFHATHGYFSPEFPSGTASLLENINVARASSEGGGQDQFVITIEHKAVPVEPHMSFPDARVMIESVIDTMHARNKAHLADILAPEIQALIRLGV